MSVDELMRDARALAEQQGRVPSKNSLQKTLKVGWEKVAAVHRTLSAEIDQAAKERTHARRMSARRAAVQKNVGRPLRTRARLLPDSPVSPAVGQPSAFASPLVVLAAEEDHRLEPTPSPTSSGKRSRRPSTWPVLLLTLPAFVVIWSGWVDMGRLTGFGVVHPLPGIADHFALNTAITLPIGLETYAAYALWVWLSGAVEGTARQFAKRSAIGALVLGAGGQVAYHLMVASGMTKAPWWITTLVACLPVAVLGLGAALRHLIGAEQ